jgi:hypothetical protein
MDAPDLAGKAGKMKIAAIIVAAVCAAGLAGTSAASAATGTSAPKAERINAYKISPVAMVDNAGGRQADGNAVQMWSRGNKANEEWGYSPVNSVFFQIRDRHLLYGSDWRPAQERDENPALEVYPRRPESAVVPGSAYRGRPGSRAYLPGQDVREERGRH